MNQSKVKSAMEKYVEKYDNYLSNILQQLIEEEIFDYVIIEEELLIARQDGKIYDQDVRKFQKILQNEQI